MESGTQSGQVSGSILSAKIRRRVAKRRDLGDNPDINIVPAIDLIVSLIPFLLISAIFIPISMIDTYAPSKNPPVAGKETSLIMVVVTNNGFVVSGSGPVMRGNKGKTEIPRGGKNYNYQALTNMLTQLKKNDPKAEELLLMTEPDIVYSVIIDVMDAARADSAGAPLFPNAFFGGITS